MIWARESKSEKLKNKVREDFERAIAVANSPLRDNRVFCLRVALKCRANIDTAFAKAAADIAHYDEQALLAITRGAAVPTAPAANCFQLVKSAGEFTYTYLPERYADKVFALGAAYQTLKISRTQAIEQTQSVANALWLELGLTESFEVLRFLRDEEQEVSQIVVPDSARDQV